MTYKHRMTAERRWYCTACGQTKPEEGMWCCIIAAVHMDSRWRKDTPVHRTYLVGMYLHDAWWSLPEPPFKAWRP